VPGTVLQQRHLSRLSAVRLTTQILAEDRMILESATLGDYVLESRSCFPRLLPQTD
jgi:hypothetical protein